MCVVVLLVVIINGFVVLLDGQMFYFVDMFGCVIDVYLIDEVGEIGFGCCFLIVDFVDGYFDGVICDVEGGVWVGFYGGWFVWCFVFDGMLIDEVCFFVVNIIKIVFGGNDGYIVFVIIVCQGLLVEVFVEQLFVGNIFMFCVVVLGIFVMFV